jgi:hypothetical protein
MRLPLFANWLCRLRSAPRARMFRKRLAPQERCVQLWFSSKPGGVMSPPELMELSPPGVLPLSLNCKSRLRANQFPIPREVANKREGRRAAGRKLPGELCYGSGRASHRRPTEQNRPGKQRSAGVLCRRRTTNLPGLPSKISSPFGRTAIPTSRSSSKRRRNTPSCHDPRIKDFPNAFRRNDGAV